MTIMRKTYTLILMLAMLFVGANSVKAQTVVQGDFTYGFYSNGQAYVDVYTGTDTEITIPGKITYDKDGIETTTEVRGISENAFQGNKTIEKIHIEYYTAVTYYFTLAANAFKGCTALNTFNYASTTPATGKLITDNYIILPSNSLVSSVFEGCTSIQNVYARYHMSGGIGKNAFKDCTSLQTASISGGCKSIGESAFEGCTALTKVEGCVYKYVTTSATNYYVCTIGNKAFKNCTSLKSFGSSDASAYLGGPRNTTNFTSVTSIGESAFENCESFGYVYFHRVNNIGANAFKGCTGLQIAYIQKPDGTYNALKDGDAEVTNITLGAGVFEGCTNLTGIVYRTYDGSTSTYQPETLFTTIPARAFYGCEKLVRVGGTGKGSTTETSTTNYIGACFPLVTSIGESAFEGCVALSQYCSIGSSTPTIDDNAFKGCVKLTRFGASSNNVEVRGEYVGANAFEGCIAIPKLTLYENASSIGASAFKGCSALATIVLYKMDAAPTLGEDAFTGIKAKSYFYIYPDNSYKSASKYAKNDGWKVFFNGSKGSNFLIAYVNKEKQYGTVSCDVPLYFYATSAIANLYKVIASSDNYAYMEAVSSKRLPANTGAVIDVEVDGTVKTSTAVQVLFSNVSATDWSDNLLVANVEENPGFEGQDTDGTYNLLLSDGKFVKANNGTLAAGLAYLPMNFGGGEAKELSLTTDEPTGIKTIDNGEPTVDNGAWYTIDGTRLQGEPTMKGIYVRGGKKVVVK